MKATAAKLCCILGISFVAGNVDANPNSMASRPDLRTMRESLERRDLQ